MRTSLLVAILSAALLPAPETFSPDAEGFIRNWLVLAPIDVAEDSGASEIDRDLLKGEAAIKPRDGDKVTIAGTELTWKAHQTSEFFIDFLKAFGQARGEDAAAYAVAYVIADDAMTVKLFIGSNDESKAWVNGKQIIKFADTRTLEKDTDSGEVTLAKGQNVLVFKVINEKNNWQGCARFMKDGAPVKNIRISLTPSVVS